jgi:hypothetical protein
MTKGKGLALTTGGSLTSNGFEFGILIFGFVWSLDFGTWNLVVFRA